jgi:hypothetical protein
MLFGWISSLHLVLAFGFDLCDAAFISDAYKNEFKWRFCSIVPLNSWFYAKVPFYFDCARL